MPAAATRHRILEAALACFLQDGYEQTTIGRIRERGGVSNGALFHHFGSKEAIADALHVEALTSFQKGLWSVLRSEPASLRAAVSATIAHHLSWIERNPDLARFVYMRGHLDWESPAGAELAARNRELVSAYRDWMRPFVERGELRVTSMLTISAIVAGPAHAIAQRWLAGQLTGPLSAFAAVLSEAAWAGLRGKPHVATGRAPSYNANVTLELVGDDGDVVARGQANTELKEL